MPNGWFDEGTTFSWASSVSAGAGKQFVKTDQTGTSPIEAGGTNSAIYSVSVLTYTGGTFGQYSDPVTVSASLTIDGSGVSGVTITFTIGTQSTTAVTGADGSASTTITLNQASGDYTVTASCTGAESTTLCVSEDFTINKEYTSVEYTGDSGAVTTAEDTITLRLAATLTQNDAYLGDLSLATVEFTIDGDTADGTPFSTTVHNVPVNSAGQAAAFLEDVPLGAYVIEVRIESGNLYWICEPDDDNTIAVTPSNGEGYVTGGGWIASEDSVNGKINFALVVHYDKKGNLKGSFVAVFKSTDGFNYKIKSTNWNKASLTFGTDSADNPTATLTVNGVVQKIDRATGLVVDSWGNCKITIDVTDCDYGINQNGRLDTIAIVVVDNSSTVLFQWGTKPSQIGIGGGNIVVAAVNVKKK